MFKNILKKFFFITLELALLAGALWFVATKKGYKDPLQMVPAIEQAAKVSKPFPQLAGPVERKFNWEYQGKQYALTETFYQSVENYYQNSPKTFSYFGALPADWENQYYGQFLKLPAEDKTIANLAADLQRLGQERKLTSDQVVDLTLAFVQSIPYDDAKAKEILAKDSATTMRFPYEVLYENLGVCSDKSLLAAAILKQMGYGVALLAFEQDNHMALGIKCPASYANYANGYCFAETTAPGNKIGIIPDFDSSSNKTVTVTQLQNLDNAQIQLKALGAAQVYQQTEGKTYEQIIQTRKIEGEIAKLKGIIDSMLPKLQIAKKTLAATEKEIAQMHSELMKMQGSADLNIDKYNKQVASYNEKLAAYQKVVKKFNSDVTLYNQTIARYNTLIKQ